MQEMNLGDYNMEREEGYYGHLYNKRSEKSMLACFYSLIGIIITLILSLLLSSCKSIQYVPIEKTKTEYITRTDTVNKIDTLISEKETIIREADSSLVAELGIQLKENERAILILKRELERKTSKEFEHTTDTFIKTDTIQVPYPVERKLTKWEQTKIDIGEVCIGMLILVAIILIVFILIRVYRRIHGCKD